MTYTRTHNRRESVNLYKTYIIRARQSSRTFGVVPPTPVMYP